MQENCRVVLQMCPWVCVIPEGRAVGRSYREASCNLVGVVGRIMSKSFSVIFVNILQYLEKENQGC